MEDKTNGWSRKTKDTIARTMMLPSLMVSSRSSAWRSSSSGIVVSFVTAVGTVPAVCLMFVVFSATGLVVVAGDRSGQCPLVTNGRLDECTAMINKTVMYTDQQLHQACKQSELQAGPQCLQKIVEECQKQGYVDPQQIKQLQNTTIVWQNKFDRLCATILELHQSTGTRSLVSTSSSLWHVTSCLHAVLAILLALCLSSL